MILITCPIPKLKSLWRERSPGHQKILSFWRTDCETTPPHRPATQEAILTQFGKTRAGLNLLPVTIRLPINQTWRRTHTLLASAMKIMRSWNLLTRLREEIANDS